MCGFVTIIDFQENKSLKKTFNLLKKINEHRGPDNIKILHDKNFSVLFRRLSILDTSSNANQPFYSLDKQKCLVFNGEIYNFVELKILLKKKYRFSSSSDTEVIMKCYEEWGIKFINKLRGMFSIVLYDKLLKKTFFIRDRLGQKPLFYTYMKNSLIVSSEIKDILFVLKKHKFKISENKEVVEKYLLRGWADDSNSSFFENIFKFPAGTYSIYKNKTLSKPKFYWKLNIKKQKEFNHILFKKKFNENIRLHLRSDVPIATTLSGGLDSGSINAISKKYNKNITAFSCISSYSDESETIDSLLSKLNIRHHYIYTEKLYKNTTLRNLIKFQDEPLLSASHFDQYLLRKKIRSRGFKVILVGEGGDEVLGGYARLAITKLCDPSLNTQHNINNIYKNLQKYFNLNKLQVRDKIIKFKSKKKIKNDIEDFTPFEFLREKKKLNLNLRYKNPFFYGEKNLLKKSLKQQILERDLPHIVRAEDRISMANSLENRSPFLDHEFIEYVLSHKVEYFFKNGVSKYMLRKAMVGYLPKKYIDFKKVNRPGNNSRILNFYSNQFKTLLKKYDLGIFDKKKILKKFLLDRNKKEFNKISVFYFRVLNYLIWKDINFRT